MAENAAVGSAGNLGPQAPGQAVGAEESFLATRRGKLILLVLCTVAFIDFIDASIVNIALPQIHRALHFSSASLVWVPSGYLLTYGGFMLLGGRAADLLGRRRLLIAGTVVIGLASLVGGLAQSSGALVGARLMQGVGAAMGLPAALSILTTTFKEGKDRHVAIGVWSASAAIASVGGVLLGGLLTQGPGWRWVFFVNPIACALVLAGIFAVIGKTREPRQSRNFDFPGAVLVTGGVLLLVYAIVKAPSAGWGATRTIGEIAGAIALLVAFVINEQRAKSPLAALSVFRINGLAFSDLTQLLVFAGFSALFFFLTQYMQQVLGYSAIKTGLSYVPLTIAVGVAAGISAQLLTRTGTRAIIVVGALIAAGGVYWLSKIPVHGSYLSDLLPGMLIMSIGFGFVATATTAAANAGVPADKAGLAASLLQASQQLGAALGLAVLTAISTSRATHALATHASVHSALTSGYRAALLAGVGFLAAGAILGLRATNTRDQEPQPTGLPEPAIEPNAAMAATL